MCWQRLLKHTGLHHPSLQEQCLPLILSTSSWSILYMVNRIPSTYPPLHIDYNYPSVLSSPFPRPPKVKAQFGAGITPQYTQNVVPQLRDCTSQLYTAALQGLQQGRGPRGAKVLWKEFETKPWILSLDTQEIRKGRDGRKAVLCLWQYNHVEVCLAE